MNIEEVEQLVGMAKSNIKYYEGEGLLAPSKNKETNKKEYLEAEVVALQKIKLLRTVGVPLDDVKSLMLSNKDMTTALQTTEDKLSEDILTLKEKHDLCTEIRTKNETFHAINLEAYDLKAQLPHTDEKELLQTDRVFKARLVIRLASLVGILLSLTLLFLPIIFSLLAEPRVFPTWGIITCGAIEFICILILTFTKKKKCHC